jgi:hypothetical protein
MNTLVRQNLHVGKLKPTCRKAEDFGSKQRKKINQKWS